MILVDRNANFSTKSKNYPDYIVVYKMNFKSIASNS